MNTKEFLQAIANANGPSGQEYEASAVVASGFSPWVDSVETDRMGNVYAVKEPTESSENPPIILIDAHVDEIALMIKDITDEGYLYVHQAGGFDPRTLLAQEVVIHGRQEVIGIVAAKSNAIQAPDEKEKVLPLGELMIDTGLSMEQVRTLIRIGDRATIRRETMDLMGDCVTGKALDDRAGIAVMYACAQELKKLRHEARVIFQASVQEETTALGASVGVNKWRPDFAIAVDVGFGMTPEVSVEDGLEMGKGPGISLGSNSHRKLYHMLLDTAKAYQIPTQLELTPTGSGTNGQPMQMVRQGVPVAVISLPLRYMHTSVETIRMKDVDLTAQLLARLIVDLTGEKKEELLCYETN
jgi:endoglucanase